jgi:predicted TIM-barrel fold metal-dependent hydrolase
MDLSRFADIPVIDCHVHGDSDREQQAARLSRFAEFMSQVMRQGRLTQVYLSGSWPGLYLKAKHNTSFYAGAPVAWSNGATGEPPQWREVLDGMMAAGFDGIGEFGSKPGPRDSTQPLSGPFYARFWRHCESRRIPVLCHVADPEEFWDNATAPQWAVKRNWTYAGAQFAPKEDYYADMAQVFGRHPEMSLVMAHMYFLSADLERAATFFKAYAHIAFDLTPGIELLHNMSKRRDDWRQFFITWQDRILFGTDIMPGQTVEQALARIWLLRMFLETDEEFRTPECADDLLTRYDTPFRGLALPPEVLTKIYAANFVRVFGKQARPIDNRLAAELSAKYGYSELSEMFRKLS